MIEKGKISAAQMGMMMYPVIVSNADLVVPAITSKEAGRDLWISPVIASLSGLLILLIVIQLNKRYPKETIIQYMSHIVGKVPGKILGFFLLYYYLYNCGNILRQYGEFLVSIFLNRTPMIVILGTMILLCSFAVRGGIEVVGRTAQIFVPLVIGSWILIILLLLPNLHVGNMFPILEKGIVPPLMGSVMVQPWFTHISLVAMLLPLLSNGNKAMKSGMIWITWIMITLTVLDFAALFTFGGIAGSLTFPMMEAARYISIADFLEHLDSVVMAIWVAGTFIKISVYYYVLNLGTAQWLNLTDHRSVVLPLGFFVAVFGMWAPGVTGLSAWWTSTGPFYANTFHFLLPLLLLLIALIRKKSPDKRGKLS